MIAPRIVSLVGLLALAAVTSCAKTPPDSDTSPAAGRNIRHWQEVRIYRGADLPECAYAEVGWVKAEHWAGHFPSERLKRTVWSAGGDAVIGVNRAYAIFRPSHGYDALAIRFTDPECTH